MRKRIFLLHGEGYLAPAIAHLRAAGVDVVALTSRGKGAWDAFQAVLDPGTPHLFSTHARSATLPDGFQREIRPAPARDVEGLAASAHRTIQMIDRMNLKGRSVAELYHVYLRMMGIWRTLLDDLRPDLVVYSNGAPQFGFDYLVSQLCALDGRPCLFFRHTYLEDRVAVTRDLLELPSPSASELAAVPAVPPKANEFESPTNEALNRAAMNLEVIRRKLSWAGVLGTLVGRRQIARLPPDPDILEQPTPRYIEMRWHFFRGRLLCRQCLAHYDALARPPDFSRPYVYFPLPTEPEEGSVPLGGRFQDSLHTLATLSRALPQGWRIYVKEHPNQFNRKYLMSKGGRSLAFYDELSRIPGVQVVPLETSSYDLTRHARAVCVVSGTVGWEAIQREVPAVVFGHPWYASAPGVIRAGDGPSAAAALAKLAQGERGTWLGELRKWEWLMRERYTRPLIYSTEFIEHSKLTVEAHNRTYADIILEALA